MKDAYVVNNNCDDEIIAVYTNKAKALQCAFDIILDVAKISNWTDEEVSEYVDEFIRDNYCSDIVSIIKTVLEE